MTSHLPQRGVLTPTPVATLLNLAAMRRQGMYRILLNHYHAIHNSQFSKVLTQQF